MARLGPADGTWRARVQALVSMAPTTETDPAIAAKLVGMERYNPSNIDILEAFVDTQCANGSYDLDANLALLKLCVQPWTKHPRGHWPTQSKALTDPSVHPGGSRRRRWRAWPGVQVPVQPGADQY